MYFILHLRIIISQTDILFATIRKGEFIVTTNFQNLNLSNSYLFAAALSDKRICQIVLESIFNKKFENIHIKAEHTILFNSDYRSIRLDIYAEDADTVKYNLEMQNQNQRNLPKRARFHQAELDLSSLKPGEDFNQLNPSFIVFICTFDPFGKGLYRYTFQESCKEIDIPLGDETTKIFLNTKGKNPDVPISLIHFLKYLEDSTDECATQLNDKRIYELHDKVTELKKSRNLEVGYMYLTEWLKIEQEKGHEIGYNEGRADGEQLIIRLIQLMSADNSAESIPLLASNPEFFQEMLQKYNL